MFFSLDDFETLTNILFRFFLCNCYFSVGLLHCGLKCALGALHPFHYIVPFEIYRAKKTFLDADTQLYKRLCPSIGPLVHWSVGSSVHWSLTLELSRLKMRKMRIYDHNGAAVGIVCV